ncbi:hypothetical protein GH984_08775 [Spiribacter sp. C176]|uniref:Prepilin-type N-terminal cleavage/methylation domain-containing protein n=1 Tax=Spiribacter salilacus TaxID=2664894 RepID=A0A6N7QTS1_9GAMM|nr:hypothetical protein [Spiribacter salilacus]MRH78799.1 hypothetical protein [Spiribacter salilacus]
MDRRFHYLNANRGASLIEVLVASLLLSIGLVSFALAQSTSVTRSADSISRFQAQLLAGEWVALVRAHADQAVPPGRYASWQDQVEQVLTEGQGEVLAGPQGTQRVQVQWQPRHRQQPVIFEQIFLP